MSHPELCMRKIHYNPDTAVDSHMDIAITKNCYQYLLVIILDTRKLAVDRFRHYIIRNRHLLTEKNGSFVGVACADFEATDIRCKWSAKEVPFLFVFDDPQQITRFLKDLRIKDVFHIVLDAIAIPLTNVLRSPETYPFMELTFHDVKYVHKFRDYVFQLPDLATKNKGMLVAGTKSLRIYSGERFPNYIVATQWTHKEYFAQYLRDVEGLLNGEQYACTVRVLFTVTPHYAPPDM
ncbi:hypothetical protein CSKR_100587 [Clonorchis sinensis]|uniref:Uncharacterized protein n=2 Tax=Clonorchis sinensis TaxID=79923 RepID=A0A8T1MKR8_CLOSI|nr:hypothetical protein CSKR_100587 [Clonorchis sinensis]